MDANRSSLVRNSVLESQEFLDDTHQNDVGAQPQQTLPRNNGCLAQWLMKIKICFRKRIIHSNQYQRLKLVMKFKPTAKVQVLSDQKFQNFTSFWILTALIYQIPV